MAGTETAKEDIQGLYQADGQARAYREAMAMIDFSWLDTFFGFTVGYFVGMGLFAAGYMLGEMRRR